MFGDIIIVCLLILFFLLCYRVVCRAEEYFGKLLYDAEEAPDPAGERQHL